MTVSKGTTVTWAKGDSVLHAITSGSPSGYEEQGKLFDLGYDFASGKNIFLHIQFDGDTMGNKTDNDTIIQNINQ